MQENFGSTKQRKILRGVLTVFRQENAINLKFGDVTVKLPAIIWRASQPKNLLGLGPRV